MAKRKQPDTAPKTAPETTNEEETKSGGAGSKYTAPALEKGLDILEFLSSVDGEYTLMQIAEGLGRTKGEIFRMLAVLESRGYVDRGEEGERYRVSGKMFRLGVGQPRYRSLTAIATPIMELFAQETQYPCHLSIPTGAQMVVIARAECPGPVSVAVRVGHRQSLLDTGSGLCLLAFMSAADRTKAIGALRAADPWLDLDALEARLTDLRSKPCLIEPSHVMEGVYDIACPIRGSEGKGAIASLTVPYVRLVGSSSDPDSVAKSLAHAATRITQVLSEL